MAINAAIKATKPSIENAEIPTFSQWVSRVPGCMIQERMFMSAMVMPLELVLNALRVSTCPRKATKTVVKDNSMLFANAVKSSDAVDGGSLPSLEIRCP